MFLEGEWNIMQKSWLIKTVALERGSETFKSVGDQAAKRCP